MAGQSAGVPLDDRWTADLSLQLQIICRLDLSGVEAVDELRRPAWLLQRLQAFLDRTPSEISADLANMSPVPMPTLSELQPGALREHGYFPPSVLENLLGADPQEHRVALLERCRLGSKALDDVDQVIASRLKHVGMTIFQDPDVLRYLDFLWHQMREAVAVADRREARDRWKRIFPLPNVRKRKDRADAGRVTALYEELLKGARDTRAERRVPQHALAKKLQSRVPQLGNKDASQLAEMVKARDSDGVRELLQRIVGRHISPGTTYGSTVIRALIGRDRKLTKLREAVRRGVEKYRQHLGRLPS